jgi:hypothetical protein
VRHIPRWCGTSRKSHLSVSLTLNPGSAWEHRDRQRVATGRGVWTGCVAFYLCCIIPETRHTRELEMSYDACRGFRFFYLKRVIDSPTIWVRSTVDQAPLDWRLCSKYGNIQVGGMRRKLSPSSLNDPQREELSLLVPAPEPRAHTRALDRRDVMSVTTYARSTEALGEVLTGITNLTRHHHYFSSL